MKQIFIGMNDYCYPPVAEVSGLRSSQYLLYANLLSAEAGDLRHGDQLKFYKAFTGVSLFVHLIRQMFHATIFTPYERYVNSIPLPYF